MATPTEDIKQRIDIVDLINEYVPLKAAGQNWKARCPFHNEKTPSFMVSRERGTWHCFGCSRGGDIFSFVQEYEGMDFPEALRLLAKRAGVQLKSYDPQEQTQRTKALDVLRWLARYYHEVLQKSHEAEGIRGYLAERGLKPATIEDFQLGYAPIQGDAAYQAMKKKGLADEDMFQAGLIIKSERGTGFYDRFRGRIMFPIADPHGSVIAFSGRVYDANLDPNRPTPPKYINSPQTIVYNKSLVLYAMDKAKASIKETKRAVIVEGYMDCIASHQAGVTNVVATCGTALTRDQVEYLKRFTTTLVFAFDQDAAGAQAVLRGVDQALQAGVDVLILTLPFGKDPDELIKKDAAAWIKAVAEAKPALEYFFDQSVKDRDLSRVQDKKAMAKELLPIIAKVGEPIEQTHYLQRLAKMLSVDESILRQSLPANTPGGGHGARKPATASAEALPRTDRYRLLSERLLALLAHQPKFLGQVAQGLNPETLVGDDLRALYKTLVIWYTQHHVTARSEVERLAATVDPDQQERLTLTFLLADKEYPSDVSTVDIEQDFLTMVTSLKRQWLALQLRQLEGEIRQFEAAGAGGSQQLTERLDRFRDVTAQLRELPS